jgi:hypothetical protein
MYAFILMTFLLTGAIAQPHESRPVNDISREDVEMQLRFLADDALKGRYTGSEGGAVAAAFIKGTLLSLGYQSPEGVEGLYQPVPLQAVSPPDSSALTIGSEQYIHLQDYLILGGKPTELTANAVFAGYGWRDDNQDDYEGLDVDGKVVFVLPGTPEGQDPNTVFQAMQEKRKLAASHGAVALFELYRLNFPWNFFLRYFGKESMRLAEESEAHQSMTYGWINDISGSETWADLQKGIPTEVGLFSSGFRERPINSRNVVGILPGTDSLLSQEYIILTAHYDHVGVGEQGGRYSSEDSIFNGARDNAMGVVALLGAAKSLAKSPPARSVIVVAFTGEELGLLGSSYYAENPVIPLSQTIFNLNMDGGGYNTTEHVSVFGYDRVGVQSHLDQAASQENLNVLADPAPRQNLYDRSDNVSFAKKGVPAITFSPGLTDFDEEIGKYYHRPEDEASSVDMDYLLKYCLVAARTARLIANDIQRPFWVEGDAYEPQGKLLYGVK